jgi:hypothetical protein
LIRAEGEAFKRGAVRVARGKPWTDAELKLLMDMAAKRLSPQEIFDSGKLPSRTLRAIGKQVYGGTIVRSNPGAIVHTIEPAEDAMSMERVVKLFSTAFEQICGLTEVDKLVLERLRLIFQAAKDYGPLLAGYEKWEKIERQIEELTAAVAELQAAKGAKKV